MFKKVREDAILPTQGSKYSTCVDLYAYDYKDLNKIYMSEKLSKLLNKGIVKF